MDKKKAIIISIILILVIILIIIISKKIKSVSDAKNEKDASGSGISSRDYDTMAISIHDAIHSSKSLVGFDEDAIILVLNQIGTTAQMSKLSDSYAKKYKVSLLNELTSLNTNFINNPFGLNDAAYKRIVAALADIANK